MREYAIARYKDIYMDSLMHICRNNLLLLERMVCTPRFSIVEKKLTCIEISLMYMISAFFVAANLQKRYSNVASCPEKAQNIHNVDSSISNTIIYVHYRRVHESGFIYINLLYLLWKFMVFYWHSLIILSSCALVHTHKQCVEYKSTV